MNGSRSKPSMYPRRGSIRPVSPSDLLATLYKALGIPLDTHYEDASGRPVSIVGMGQIEVVKASPNSLRALGAAAVGLALRPADHRVPRLAVLEQHDHRH